MSDLTLDAVKRIESKVDRIAVALDGDQHTDTKGLRARMREAEERLTAIEAKQTADRLAVRLTEMEVKLATTTSQITLMEATINKYRWIVYGIGLGLGVTGISSIGSLLLQVFKP